MKFEPARIGGCEFEKDGFRAVERRWVGPEFYEAKKIKISKRSRSSVEFLCNGDVGLLATYSGSATSSAHKSSAGSGSINWMCR